MRYRKLEQIQLSAKYTAIGLALSLLLLSCSIKNAQEPAVSIENRFFTLDFEQTVSKMSDVEEHFFTTFPHDDPTNGDVVYDRTRWQNDNMIDLQQGDGLYLFVKGRNDALGFDSFRFTTKAFYNLDENTPAVLFVFKGQLPSGKGIWPAWWLNGSKQESWMYKNSSSMPVDTDLDTLSGKGHFYDTQSAVNGTDWPAAGEVDIIETINGDNIIHNTIHTCPQMCDSEWNSNGEVINCANAKGGDPNAGCSGKPYRVDSPEGTFACLWEKNRIRFYYWTPESDVRKDGGPLSKNPDPEQWTGSVLKNTVRLFETDEECDDALHHEWQCNSCEGSNTCTFTNMKMIFNTTLCGKWAGRNFDGSEKSMENCQGYIRTGGREQIHNQFMKIEYVSVSKI